MIRRSVVLVLIVLLSGANGRRYFGRGGEEPLYIMPLGKME